MASDSAAASASSSAPLGGHGQGSEEERNRLPVEHRHRGGVHRSARTSLAATLGFIVAVKGVGVHAPAVLLASFLPMLLIAAAYKYLNRADPDAGTTFAWTTCALGPATGWVNGWRSSSRT